MPVPTVFDLCTPRPDILQGRVTEAEFAADLARVLSNEGGTGYADYADPTRFFANTYPTRGLKDLLANVCRRLSGAGGEVAAIFRLDTSYGGGKTHGLIALAHAAKGMQGVADPEEFIDPSLLPSGPVRVAAFDGENADPANGRMLENGVLAKTPWGELAHALAGKQGFERVRASDEKHMAPGASTLRELFGDQPTLILLDELSVYLRSVQSISEARGQLTAFLTRLLSAVESTPRAALVYTLAIGKGNRAKDAYSDENKFIADAMQELEKVSARKATILNPTREEETARVLRRRLFEAVDYARAEEVIQAYKRCWDLHEETLPPDVCRPATIEDFRASYPFHPAVLETLTKKTATLQSFQRVRGMLRLLGKTVAHLWETRRNDACAVHLHHVDPGHEPIRAEIVTRLGQDQYRPAITNDVSSGSPDKPSFAQQVDISSYSGLPPYAEYAARTIFLHSLAFNEPLKGLPPEELRYSMIGPVLDISFIDDARKKFVAESAYLDDRPGAAMRFLVDANLNQIVRREERNVDAGDARAQLNDRIRQVFGGRTFDLVHFPGGPYDVDDNVGSGRPRLAILSYDGVSIGPGEVQVPELIGRIYLRSGKEGRKTRGLRNNVVFLVADGVFREKMRAAIRHRLALTALNRDDRLADLAEYQQANVRELDGKSEQAVALAIQTCYRHLFYPSQQAAASAGVALAHTAIDIPSASDQPGAGQNQVVRVLRELGKLRLPEDSPDQPAYVRDATPLKVKGEITTQALRTEFRRNPKLPILVGNDVFVKGVRQGVRNELYVYRSGDLLWGPGEPAVQIRIDEQSMVLTMAYAKDNGIWPRPKPADPDPPVDPEPPIPPPPPPPPGTTPVFEAEGILREALLQLWEKARANKEVNKLGELTIRIFDAEVGFPLLRVAASVPKARKAVKITSACKTAEGGELELRFAGPISQVRPITEFLEPQLRAATEPGAEVSLTLSFPEGLTLDGTDPEKLTERLSRFVSGSAHVTARALEKGD
ncbi:MAG: DUF499 domain-containing protein [Gemmatimonadota bacterium]|nr:DUF499 domain-containing protein [Gemmatimonadota bacterium]